MNSPRRGKRNGTGNLNKKGVTWVTDPTQVLEPKVTESGPGSYKPVTIIEAPNNWGKTSVYEAVRWCLYDLWPKYEERDSKFEGKYGYV